MAEPVLAIDRLTVEYESDGGRGLALDDVSLHINTSEILGVVGESGCGKSTLGMTILGLLPANGRIATGTITLDGRDLGALDGDQMRGVRGREVAMIFQDPATSLNPRLTIGKQLVQVQRAHAGRRTASTGALRRTGLERLAEVGLPNPKQAFDRYPHEFSGGMRQRVMIAMSLLFEPRMIIADEATSALDVTLEAQILELLLRLREAHGTAVLFISHDLGVVSQMCDRVLVMYAGRIVEETTAEAVLASPAHPYSQALQAAMPNRSTPGRRLAAIGGRVPDLAVSVEACNFAPRCIAARAECGVAAPDLYPHAHGAARCFVYSEELGALWPRPPATSDWRDREAAAGAGAGAAVDEAPRVGTLVDVVDLKVHFQPSRRKPAVRAVDGVSLTVERGTILGIVGESGSGKTTLGEALVKLLPPTGGSIRFAGADVTRMSGRETFAFRRRAQMIFQNPYSSLSPRMQIGRLLTEPYAIHGLAPSDRHTVEELLAAVGLPTRLQAAYPSQVSGGQARRVGIARALALEPDMVVADEPTSGLDTSAAASTINLLTDLRDRTGLTVILISHSLALVTTVADQICVMYFGQIVEQGDTTSVTGAPAHPYTKALLELVPDPENVSRLTRRRLLVPGEIPSPDSPPTGCRFHPRCMYAQDICREAAPVLGPTASGSGPTSHLAACHFAREVQSGAAIPQPSAAFGSGAAR